MPEVAMELRRVDSQTVSQQNFFACMVLQRSFSVMQSVTRQVVPGQAAHVWQRLRKAVQRS